MEWNDRPLRGRRAGILWALALYVVVIAVAVAFFPPVQKPGDRAAFAVMCFLCGSIARKWWTE